MTADTRRRWAGGRRRAAVRLAAAMLPACLVLSACSGRGASLGTTSTPCFHALPAAASAVHGKGRLLGVRLVDVSKLRDELLRASVPPRTEVCLVAFGGSYTPTSVNDPLDNRSGPYAVVAVRPDGSKVYGSLVVRRLPLTFQHGHTL